MNTRVHLVIAGRVQGVCFRMDACGQARRLGLTGWVRNRADGSVEALAQGASADIKAFVDWCRRGPPLARVTGVTEQYSSGQGGSRGFDIRY